LLASYESCLNMSKLTRFKNRSMKVVCITLPPDSGLVLKTGRDPEHYSWWRTVDFDPITTSVPILEP
jgi:hypothetical protein